MRVGFAVSERRACRVWYSQVRARDERRLSYVYAVAYDFGVFGVRLPDEMRHAEAQRRLPSAPNVRRRGSTPARSPQPNPRKPGRPWSGAKAAEEPCGSNLWPFAFMLGPAVRAIAKPTDGGAGPGLKAGSWANAQCRARTASPSGSSVPCLPRPSSCGWSSWRICAGRVSNSMRTPRANAARITFRGVVGRGASPPAARHVGRYLPDAPVFGARGSCPSCRRGGFSPSAPDQFASLPSPGARAALPGSGVMAH